MSCPGYCNGYCTDESVYTDIKRELDSTYRCPQNLPKADAYSLLADVRTIIEKCKLPNVNNAMPGSYIDTYNLAVDDVLKILSEHFS
jgi:hypothetical protein